MKTIKIKNWDDIPKNYTGIVERATGSKTWLKNGNAHREDGPAWIISLDNYKSWYLDGNFICNSRYKFDLTNQIILSKTQHPLYPIVQVWKILGTNGLYEQIIIPGMEEYIKE